MTVFLSLGSTGDKGREYGENWSAHGSFGDARTLLHHTLGSGYAFLCICQIYRTVLPLKITFTMRVLKIIDLSKKKEYVCILKGLGGEAGRLKFI